MTVYDPFAFMKERGKVCRREHRVFWKVVHRYGNFSAFHGYHWTPSDYSLVLCDPDVGGCGRRWRTKAAYVAQLPDRSR